LLYRFHAALLLFSIAVFVDEHYRTLKCPPPGRRKLIAVATPTS
jgi:hypothetical protein